LKNFAFELREKGYARVQAITAAETTLEIARRLGSPSVISGVAPVQELVPRSAEQASASSYGRIYGLGQFPLHTDMAHWYVPPRYFLLRCVQPAPKVKTLALHSRHLFADEDEVTLRRALFRPRRRLDGRLTGLRLLESGRCRWDPVFIVPITASAFELRKRALLRIETARIEELSLEDSTDCIIFDNWNVLHGRNEVPVGCVQRKVERVYLDSVHV
jgi:hypothetical protein